MTPLASLDDALDRSQRIDVAGLPKAAIGFVLTRLSAKRTVVITADAGDTTRVAQDLRFFLGPTDSACVLEVPDDEFSPYFELLRDPVAEMERLARLSELSRNVAWRFLVLPVRALLRRQPPPDVVRALSRTLGCGDEISRADLSILFQRGGWARVPSVEDRGTYAIRGALVDVFPPAATHPTRLEFDDERIVSLKHFDAETQRTLGDAPPLVIHPVRELVFADDEQLQRTLSLVRDYNDSANVPTADTRRLLDELERGMRAPTHAGLLPLVFEQLSDFLTYAGPEARLCFVDAAQCRSVAERMYDALTEEHTERSASGKPALPPERHVLSTPELAEYLRARPVLIAQQIVVLESAAARAADDLWGSLEHTVAERLVRLDVQRHTELRHALTTATRTPHARPLAPLVDAWNDWRDRGLRTFVVARSVTQQDRLAALLEHAAIPALRSADAAPATGGALDAVTVLCGSLSEGFHAPELGIVYLTETDLFGERQSARREAKHESARSDPARSFLQDFRELHTGDLVVHEEHGIGRYVGLERKRVSLSRAEEMQGRRPLELEVLVVEYADGDKLFVPVTRLSVLEKYGGAEASEARLDKLGGQTFSRKQTRARKAARAIAEDLLRLYAERHAATRPSLPSLGYEFDEFVARFGFDETPDQARAIDDVLSDLEGERPMDRVVCGDVGFGKTEVALRAAFRVALAGRQVALLCPTTLLASQHFETFSRRFEGFPVRIASLSRFVPRAQQVETLRDIKAGTIDILIGTHRVLSSDVHFKNLGLVIIDEEQRFGVTHKERLRRMRAHVDLLTLSATPIPRTLQMALSGIRSLSLIRTAPIERQSVRTFISRWDEATLRDGIERELRRHGQVFFVHNRIESLHECAARVAELAPKARIAVVHGRLDAHVLERTMLGFIHGDYDILVTTAIVENGLDIPRANTIFIDRSDRLGMSQLYQLRGRVGRARERGYCYLLIPSDRTLSDEARQRLAALEQFVRLGSGFQIASLDMELRGAGELLGAEQSGHVAAVGFELFVRMLEDAVAEARGTTPVHSIDPDVVVAQETYLPDDYIDDIGLRLSLYKRLSDAASASEVEQIGEEMADRFGPLPKPARDLVRLMVYKPQLRALRALGCDASESRVIINFANDTPLRPDRLLDLTKQSHGALRLLPDGRIARRFTPDTRADGIDRLAQTLRELDAAHDLQPLYASTN